MTENNPYNATLLNRKDINEALAIFTVGFVGDEKLDFEPGQFTTLAMIDPDAPPRPAGSRRRGPKMIRRAYSIANTPGQHKQGEFYIVRVNDGKLTPMLWQLKPGDPLFMDTKVKGEFTLEGVPENKHLILIATGTGLAPYWSMINTYRNQMRWQKLILLESCRNVADLAYHDQLKSLAAEDDSIIYLPTVTREPADSPWKGLRGRIENILKPEAFKNLTGIELDPEKCIAMLCGNPQMIEQTTESLNNLGFITQNRDHPDGNIRTERYW